MDVLLDTSDADEEKVCMDCKRLSPSVIEVKVRSTVTPGKNNEHAFDTERNEWASVNRTMEKEKERA